MAADIVVIYAHPFPKRSRANRVLIDAVREIDGLEQRSLYALYPDFSIDVEAEQTALRRARIVVWQHPLYWYSVPGLLKHWFDCVLTRGFAYGEGGDALAGKLCQWVTSTGADEHGYSAEGVHAHTFETFVPSIAQTASFCRMQWAEPIVVHGAHLVSDADLATHAHRYRARLLELAASEGVEVAS